MAPAKYDTEVERLNAGHAVCLRHADGQSDQQIAESVVQWASMGGTGEVTSAEAARFVPYALQHCGYLLSAEVDFRLKG